MSHPLAYSIAAIALAFPAMASAQNQPPALDTATLSPAEQAEYPSHEHYPRKAIGESAVTGGFASSRWGEDWREYRDPAKRDDLLDRLKYLPLDSNGDIYITLSGEVRIRTEYYENPNLIEQPSERRDRLRVIGGADLHVGPNLRFYGELVHGDLGGHNVSTKSASWQNDLAVQQAFAELSGDIGGLEAGIRYGRQEFTDGSSQLLNTRDTLTVRVALNGTRAWLRGAKVRADLFDFKFTDLGTGGIKDDRIDDGTRFSGANLGFALPKDLFGGSEIYVDPFIWRLELDGFSWGGTTGRDRRNFYGTRIWGNAGRVGIDWTVNHQSGNFNGRKISAWQAFLSQSYRLGKSSNAPALTLKADYASGGGGYNDTNGTLHNATTPYGTNAYYSYQNGLTATNLISIAPGLSLRPAKGVKLDTEYRFAWRDAENDAVYRPAAGHFAGTENVSGKYIGEMIRAQASWSITPRVTLSGRYEHLFTGTVLERAGYSDSNFFSTWLSFRF
ncbi:alginate export family protein [Altericroceibacterium indicum]|nr:alginate export family protein [Altericroceibacterium indicum]